MNWGAKSQKLCKKVGKWIAFRADQDFYDSLGLGNKRMEKEEETSYGRNRSSSSNQKSMKKPMPENSQTWGKTLFSFIVCSNIFSMVGFVWNFILLARNPKNRYLLHINWLCIFSRIIYEIEINWKFMAQMKRFCFTEKFHILIFSYLKLRGLLIIPLSHWKYNGRL